MDMSGDELLNSQPAVLVPNSLQSNSAVSPNTFSTQLVRRLRIRGTDNHEAEAADSNNNNTIMYFILIFIKSVSKHMAIYINYYLLLLCINIKYER